MDFPANEHTVCCRAQTPSPQTAERYRAALALYGTTTLSIREVCVRCGVSYSGFRSYVYKYHRELLFAHHGVAVSMPSDAAHTRLRGRRGQTAAAHAKYREAIAACDSMDYLEYNISQIAHLFGLNPTGLGNRFGLTIRSFWNAARRSAAGGVCPTTSNEASVRGAGSSMPRPWSCSARGN